MVGGPPSLIAQRVNLNTMAAQISGAQHSLSLGYGFAVADEGENTAVCQSQPDGYQVTLDAVGHWWIKLEGGEEYRGIGFVDLEAVLAPSARMF